MQCLTEALVGSNGILLSCMHGQVVTQGASLYGAEIRVDHLHLFCGGKYVTKSEAAP